MRPLVILVSGPALAGKSTFIAALSKTLNDPFTIVSSDDVRMELYGHYNYDPANEPATWNIIKQRMNNALLEGKIVILDATLRTYEKRIEQINYFIKTYPVVLFAFQPMADSILIERNKERLWKQFSEETVKRLNREYQIPTGSEKELYSRLFWIGQNTKEAIDEFLDWWQ